MSARLDHRGLLRELFDAAVDAASPVRVLPPALPPLPERGRTVMVAVGKAAASMAHAAIEHYGADLPGLVLTRHGHGVPALHARSGCEVVEAGHPVPDQAGMAAARRALDLAAGLRDGDHLLALISGGGSSLLTLPAPGLTLGDKQAVTRALLASGAPVSAINCVRKHLSAIKGGRLARAAAPARVTTLIISDVVGDDPADIASGPTAPDPTTLAEARAIVERYGVEASEAVAAALTDPANETPKPGRPEDAAQHVRIVANARTALAAASERARRAGYRPVVLGDDLEGEAAGLGRAHAEIALAQVRKGEKVALLSGGECTVTLARSARGRGGPNAEYLLSLAIALEGQPDVSALACDTDGVDGSEDNAGAIADPATVSRAAAIGVNLPDALAAHDSYGAFQALGDLVVTGPTRTNVNDFRAILIN